jgi:hypothetical protein
VTSTSAPEPTAVYRLVGSDESLLYVGISNQPRVRWQQHALDKPWWPDVADKHTTWYPDRSQAEDEEDRAILAESPRYNVRAPARDPETVHTMSIRVTEDVRERLRRAAFEHRVHMNTLVSEGIELRLAELKAVAKEEGS